MFAQKCLKRDEPIGTTALLSLHCEEERRERRMDEGKKRGKRVHIEEIIGRAVKYTIFVSAGS